MINPNKPVQGIAIPKRKIFFFNYHTKHFASLSSNLSSTRPAGGVFEFRFGGVLIKEFFIRRIFFFSSIKSPYIVISYLKGKVVQEIFKKMKIFLYPNINHENHYKIAKLKNGPKH